MKALSLLCLLLVYPLPAFSDTLLFRSNDIGMTLQPVAPYLRDSTRWILSVQRTGANEVRRLFDNGKEVKRWETTWTEKQSRREEREYSFGALSARRFFDASGDIVQEESYDAGTLTQKSLFTYAGDRLSRTRTLAPDGSLIWSEQYVYATNGALREVRRTGARGDERLSAYVSGPTGVSEERNTVGDILSVLRYDTQGRLVSREQRRGDDTLVREDFIYRSESPYLLSSQEKTPAKGRVTDRRYDESGRLASETTTEKGAVTEEVAFTRDEKGRVIAKGRRSAGGLETWKYSLDGQGKVTREEYFRLGSLQKVTVYGQGNLRTEEYYKDEDTMSKYGATT